MLLVFANWTAYAILQYSMAAVEAFTMADSCKIHERVNSQIFTGVMAFVMGIVTMVRMTRNMPKKLTDANFYSSSVYSAGGQVPSDQMTSPTISAQEFMTVMKRMAELEEKMGNMNHQNPCMPPEKEEMLNAAISRADALEQELMATKKVKQINIIIAHILTKLPNQLFMVLDCYVMIFRVFTTTLQSQLWCICPQFSTI